MIKKKLHKTIETLRVLMQICKMTLFYKLWIRRSISCFFLCYSLLFVTDCVSMCMSVCDCVCECVSVWRGRTEREGKEREC